MKSITVGKLRGLQEISSPQGILTISAMDHRGSLQRMINRKNPEKVTYDDMVKRKQELCSVLAEHSTAVLLDPLFGAAQCIGAGILPKSTGLLVSIESSGYGGGDENRVTELLEDWGVEKIKRMGASAVKILVYYRSDLKPLSGQQLRIIKRVANQCVKYDIPFLVEPVSYPVGAEKVNPEQFASLKPELVIQTARQMTDLPIDVLKAEFPADMRYNKDKSELIEICRKLDAVSQVPWVILSAGENYELFIQQVEIACRAGASGFLGGRAIWQEAMPIEDTRERVKFLSTVAVDRLKKLTEVAEKYATPWYKKLGLTGEKIAGVSEDWYRRY
ncbi:MAG: tagatose 1,6-diphosphate aldolase [Chloroflexi bacterium]|nr:tagatose 1,6-diphosphate aldolase [Chloroflexota bacterium]